MARDIAVKLSGQSPASQPSNEQPRNSDSQETEHAQPRAASEISQSPDAPESQIQVVPLYTPEGSAIKFFCVHPSHRYAMSLVPISTGFQGQVNSTNGTGIEIVFCLTINLMNMLEGHMDNL